MLAVNSLLQGMGVLVCVGAVLLVALVAIASRILSNPRNTITYRNNHGPHVQQSNPTNSGFGDDFGGVPTTGSVQEYERDYDGDTIIGSSGFDNAQTYEQDYFTDPSEDENPPHNEDD